MNGSRFIPQSPEIYRRVAEENRVFIFNVGPWVHKRELGSAGTYTIPACPDGQEYSAAVVIRGVVEEPYPINEAECKVITEDGHTVAMQVLGEGPFVPRSSSFRPFGVFISRTQVPSREDIAKAKQALQEKYVELVRLASEAYSHGPREAQEVIRPEWNFLAARALKKTEVECPWLGNTQVPAERKECFNCGTAYKVGIAQCPSCRAILDKQKFEKAVKDGLIAAIA